MTDQQILERAIKKAVDGGWDKQLLDCQEYNPWNKEVVNETYERWDSRPIYSFILNHDFAKALWGGVEYCRCPLSRKKAKRNPAFYADCICHHRWAKLDWWEYELQQMVIADDPIKYLGENM